MHDTLLFYTKSETYTWNKTYGAYEASYLEDKFNKKDEEGRLFQDITLTGPGVRTGESGLPWRGYNPTAAGRHWALPGFLVEQGLVSATGTTQERLDAMDAAGLIYWTRNRVPRLKFYLEDAPGMPLPDVWSDIAPINSQAAERLGYPTQKPEALLERVIRASSNEGDVILDPFCGCGTAVAVAQRLKRRWIGIDITYLAVSLMKYRLQHAFGPEIAKTYKVIGEPVTVEDAKQLAHDDPFQFQWWAVGLVNARAVEKKKGADQGVDGRLYFHDDYSGETKQIILSVKGGKTGPDHVRDLRGVVEREQAQIGVLITMQQPTQPMRSEAAAAGFYTSPLRSTHSKIQLLTIAELLSGKRIDYPVWQENMTFKKAPKAKSEALEAPTLDL